MVIYRKIIYKIFTYKGGGMYYPISALLIECLILSVLDGKESYGYEISQTIKMVSQIKE